MALHVNIFIDENHLKNKYMNVDFVIAEEYEKTIPELIDKLMTGKNALSCKGIWYKKKWKGIYRLQGIPKRFKQIAFSRLFKYFTSL